MEASQTPQTAQLQPYVYYRERKNLVRLGPPEGQSRQSGKGSYPRHNPHPALNMAQPPNLRLRPAKPALGRGRVQAGVRRAFLATGKPVVSTTELLAWTHPRPIRVRRRNPRNSQRHAVRRVCEHCCERVGRGTSIGRPILWKLKDGVGKRMTRPPTEAAP
jgi:hypothetical protein